MFKKKDVKKSKNIPENNNSSSGEELSEDELFNVAGGRKRITNPFGSSSFKMFRINKICVSSEVQNKFDKSGNYIGYK